MLGCVSVMTTGVVAILYQNDMQFVNNETQEISLKNLFFSLYYFYSCLIALLYRPIIRPIIDLLLVPIAKA